MNKLTYTIDGKDFELTSDSKIKADKGQVISFDMKSAGCWYGHGFANRQPYPLNAEPIENKSFMVNNIQSPIWMCQAGFAILANTTSALCVSINGGTGRFELSCSSQALELDVFAGENLPSAHKKLMAHLGWPSAMMDKSFLGDSVFCTWTQYPRNINQERIISTAQQIRKYGYPCTTITIDDIWESNYGQLDFSAAFPQPKQMMDELHRLGFKVLLWVTPFINQDANTFAGLEEKRYLVMAGDKAAQFKWWGGTAGLVDLTNPAARQWYKERLLVLKNEIGIDGFKIDGGDAKYQPSGEEVRWVDYKGPSGYIDLLLALFEEIAPGMCETRTAWLSQSRNIVWRQGGKDSHWGIENGMTAMLNLGLNMALMGYDIFMPDMIPGRVQTMVKDMALPTDELFVRWTELSAFMPLVQFSYFPWNYAAPTEQIIKQYALLHKALEDYLFEQAQGREKPLFRPMWYDFPERDWLYTVADQFMLGQDIMVAPVMDENRVARDITVPDGLWRDIYTGQTLAGGRHFQYPAPCPGIPVFVRAENKALFDVLHKLAGQIDCGTIKSGVTSATYSSGIDRDINVTG